MRQIKEREESGSISHETRSRLRAGLEQHLRIRWQHPCQEVLPPCFPSKRAVLRVTMAAHADDSCQNRRFVSESKAKRRRAHSCYRQRVRSRQHASTAGSTHTIVLLQHLFICPVYLRPILHTQSRIHCSNVADNVRCAAQQKRGPRTR